MTTDLASLFREADLANIRMASSWLFPHPNRAVSDPKSSSAPSNPAAAVSPPSSLLHTPVIPSPENPEREPSPSVQPVTPCPSSKIPPPSDREYRPFRRSSLSIQDAWKRLYDEEYQRSTELEESVRTLKAHNADLEESVRILKDHHADLMGRCDGTILRCKEVESEMAKLTSQIEEKEAQRLSADQELKIWRRTMKIVVVIAKIGGGKTRFYGDFELRTTSVGCLKAKLSDYIYTRRDTPVLLRTWFSIWFDGTKIHMDDDYAPLSSFGLVDWYRLSAQEMSVEVIPKVPPCDPHRGYIHVSACFNGQIQTLRFGQQPKMTVKHLKVLIGKAIGLEPNSFRLGFGGTELHESPDGDPNTMMLCQYGLSEWFLSVWQTGEPGVQTAPRRWMK